MNQNEQPVQQGVPNFFGWWIVDQPVFYWNLAVKASRRMLVFFSVSELIKTLFAPWKRDVYTPVNASLDIIFKSFIDNVISRIVGFVMRSVTIFVGLLATIITFIAILIILLFWLLLPFIIVAIVVWGVVR